jgi:hypothetical protein
MEMSRITELTQMKVPLGGQEIALQQIDFVEGGMGMLRLRIREGKRFTIFDLDPLTARNLGSTMQQWAESQPGMQP